jgi:GAF domain-containing protein
LEYGTLISQAAEMMREEPWYASAMSNLSALLMTSLPDLNWAGFYLMRDGRLTVGPFQGKPACIHIPVGKGVCGTAAAQNRTQLVPDVHAFPGHIACDSASASEIVIPIHRDGEVTAVLDIDSPRLSRFSGEDARGLEALVTEMEKSLRWD